MSVELTRLGKHSLIVESPVMPAAGCFGYGKEYAPLVESAKPGAAKPAGQPEAESAERKDLIEIKKLGAVVTNPVTYKPRRTARGTSVVALSGGLLLHTGMPNPGIVKVIKEYGQTWARLPIPVIVHIMGTIPPDVRRCARALADTPVQGIELGIHDLATVEEMETLIEVVTEATQLPLLVRVPLDRAAELAPAVAHSPAGAIVVGGPPRGLARDPLSGQILSGRLYGPLVKPIALRAMSQVVQLVEKEGLPVIGGGGIHSTQDARDFIEVGARAVQLDSLIWARPGLAEIIARDLGGLELTRPIDAYPDEWFPGIGETFRKKSMTPPPDLPE